MKLIELIIFGMYAAHRGSEKMKESCSSFILIKDAYLTYTLILGCKSTYFP